jgi:hypothetical protein
LIDSGAGYSAITEKETELMGLDCDSLPFYKGDCFGFGGKFKNKVINRPVHLTFSNPTSPTVQHKITFSSGFQVTCIPKILSPTEREEIIRHTPCVIGTDILRQFKFFMDYSKNRVELET